MNPSDSMPGPGDFKQEDCGMAVAALVTSVLGWLGFISLMVTTNMLGERAGPLAVMAGWSLLLPVVGAILGTEALVEIRVDPHRLRGRGFARMAVLLGMPALIGVYIMSSNPPWGAIR